MYNTYIHTHTYTHTHTHIHTYIHTFIYIYTFRGAGFLRGANDSNQPEKEHPKPDDEVPMPGDGDNRERESGGRESEPAGSSSSADAEEQAGNDTNPKPEAVSCLDWDALAFLQRLPSPELLSLGELVGVVHGAAVGAQTWTSGVDTGMLAPTSSEWDSVVIESVR